MTDLETAQNLGRVHGLIYVTHIFLAFIRLHTPRAALGPLGSDESCDLSVAVGGKEAASPIKYSAKRPSKRQSVGNLHLPNSKAYIPLPDGFEHTSVLVSRFSDL